MIRKSMWDFFNEYLLLDINLVSALMINISLFKNFLLRVHFYLLGVKNVMLIIFFVVFNFITVIAFALLARLIGNQNLTDGFKTADTQMEMFILAALVAPILETLIFQYAIIASLKPKVPTYIACLISALLFALSHCYNLYYFCFAYVSGLLLAYLFCLKKSMLTGSIITAIAHMVYNTLVLLIRNS